MVWKSRNNCKLENDGFELKNFKNSVIRKSSYYFKEALTWSTISSSDCSFRYSSTGNMFETKGSNYFVKNYKDFYYLFGF